MICCDDCDKAYHSKCIGVKVDDLPDPWSCTSCSKDDGEERKKSAKSGTSPPQLKESADKTVVAALSASESKAECDVKSNLSGQSITLDTRSITGPDI